MGDVIVVFSVMPDGPGSVDLVRHELEKLKPQRLEIEPIAFGISSVKFTKVIPDKGGAIDELEKKLSSISHVKSVAAVRISRSL